MSLYQLHGSINRYYSGAEEFFGETICCTQYRDGLAGVWREQPTELPKAEARAVVDKIPPIVPPATDKRGFLQHETFRSLWFRAHQAIARSDRVVCMGYSLPSSDGGMVEFLKDAGDAGQGRVQLEIVDGRPHRTRHFRGLLGRNTFAYDQRIHGGTSLPDFVRTQCALAQRALPRKARQGWGARPRRRSEDDRCRPTSRHARAGGQAEREGGRGARGAGQITPLETRPKNQVG